MESPSSEMRLTEAMYTKVCECLSCCMKQCEGRLDKCASSNIFERLNEITKELAGGTDQLNRTEL